MTTPPIHPPIDDQYFNAFGSEQRATAASMKSLHYCEALINSMRLTSILDAGSGLSSAFFQSRYPDVTTVDDNPFWAEKTKDFIAKHLNKQIDIHPISAVSDQRYDFIYYDYGHIETRIYYFRMAMALCTKAMYIDDMHISFYRDYVQSRAKNHGLTIIEETTDEFGRYGALFSPNRSAGLKKI